MADDRIREKIVTEFFLSTCQLRRRVSQNDSLAFLLCAEMTAKPALKMTEQGRYVDVEPGWIPLITGSVAEFYIEPMLPCFGDVDVMGHHSTALAIPAGHLPPTQLPGEFGGRVEVYDIISAEFPGYVYLISSYLLTECADDGKYNAAQCERYLVKHIDVPDDIQRHGPAFLSEKSYPSADSTRICVVTLPISMDEIYCVRCLVWPQEAADWPTRQRKNGWPDSETVNRVVSNGCDVVPVAHRLCRQNEMMSQCQQRLSFSRAEIVLLNSWTPVQQIVYHMLRVFVKTKLPTDSTNNSGASTLSNYHIKTLMMWACELKSRSWWTDDLNLVYICIKLLHTLAVWLNEACCQHFFINKCNLFDQFENSYAEATGNGLMSITREQLCKWFIDSYLYKCAQLCHSCVLSSLWSPSSESPREQLQSVVCLQNVVSEIATWKMDMSRKSTLINFSLTQWNTMAFVSRNSLTLQLCLCWMDELAKADEILHVYFTAMVFLHGAYKTALGPVEDEMLDVLGATCYHSGLSDTRRSLNARHSSVLSLSQAAILMKVVANNSRSTVHQIDVELSKAYLHRALRCEDSDSNSIYCLANVYLAVLYYTTRQYQKAIDHCTLVTWLEDHSQCSSHVVQGELLRRIDHHIDNIFGLAVFYQYIQAVALNEEQEKRHVCVFTTELFAHYLHIKFLSVTKRRLLSQMSLTEEIQRYRNSVFNSPEIYVTDVMLFLFVNRTRYPPTNRQVMADRAETKLQIRHQLDTSKLCKLLQQSAVKHLTKFLQLQLRDFGSLVHVVTADFEALYAYKRGKYRRCLELSTSNVNKLTGGKSPWIMDLHNGIPMYLCPELIQLMDDEIVSLIGLMSVVMVNPSHESYLLEVAIHQLSLSLYLTAQCQIKLCHSVTSLSRTLDCVRTACVDFEMERLYYTDADQLILNFVEQKLLRNGVPDIYFV